LAVGFCLVFPTIVTLAYFVWLADRADTLKVAYGVGKLIQFGFPVAFAWFFLRDRIGWPTGDRRGVSRGLIFGAVIVALGLAIYAWLLKPNGALDAAAGQIEAKVAGFGITSAAAYFLLAAFYSVAHSGLEEYYWRWFVFGQLRRQTSRVVAIVISSIGFMAHHVVVLGVFFGWSSPLTYLFSVAIAIGGAVWAWLYDDSDSVLAPWISHALVDAGIFAIGYDVIRSSLA
jgi:membrane protease YdiL (CAAX protease family)